MGPPTTPASRSRGNIGNADVDIDAVRGALRHDRRSGHVVAVIDDGVDFSHPDLSLGPGRIPGSPVAARKTNGIDDDGNGYIDDVHGWDFCNDDNTVHDFDQDFHGTHVAGTIAASLDGQGVVGVAPSVSIMALKFLDHGPSCGLTSQAIEAIAYAKSFGVVHRQQLVGRRGPGLADFAPLTTRSPNSGMLFVASAGNRGHQQRHQPAPAYPASFDLPNIISVAAADWNGGLA